MLKKPQHCGGCPLELEPGFVLPEVGGDIHDRAMQEQVFRLLSIGDEDAQRRFGHMLEAFEFGAPPHAGFAPGIDRVVAQLAGEDDIREVIAFPKTKTGADPMTGAPSQVTEQQLNELGIRIIEDPAAK